ncbi:hypothetical protein B5S33_g269 [[Candida] boidinii]|nr:hypothetical protein B5S30_g941 [[Candida] boidinii]OWB81650.1 hypothetical protein B5S33_g269 [[Candida] boidinii]
MPPKKSKTEQYKPEEDQYRPYAQADIILNLHGKINKTTMTKCLNDLVESGKILCKSFGKFNCYFCKPMDVTDNGQKLSSLQGSNNVDLDTDLSGYEEDLKRLQTQNITLQKGK